MDFQFRNVYNSKVVSTLANRIKKVHKQFDNKSFTQSINPKLATLNYGEREKLITQELTNHLPTDFTKSAKILIKALPQELQVKPGETDWSGFITLPQTIYIAQHGLHHFDLSMRALYEMTKRLSSEMGIRPFIEKYPKQTLALLKEWTKDKNVHVRRLVSEGTRPRLPLCSPLRQFIKDPRPVIKLLNLLKDDPDLYVRRSVANNLNDIAKDNPDLLIKTLKKWKKGASKERMWLIRHSLRTLFKRGNTDALDLMGYHKPSVTSSLNLKTTKIAWESTLHFTATVTSQSQDPQKLMIDYIIHYIKANRKHASKTFKLAIKALKPKETITLSTKQSFKQMTTRKHYPGIHYIQLMVNGKKFEKKEFILENN